ncbi:helix-turn-helix domain-containing protein [Azorhizophilus paspali]|uniref:Helix-turn-helix domain-containing protein n=1 Tax=Azorhizophilus paspali TaxID=69963 RepID=A0ABV6SJM3_AZOPA
MKKAAPVKESGLENMQVDDTSLSSQRVRLLAYMQAHGSINTFEAISKLNIVRPGARIAELRAAGHKIRTHLGELRDDQGRPHPKVATYYLSAEPINLEEVAA